MAVHIDRSQLVRSATLGLVVALVGVIVLATPLGRWAEESGGLSWLFKLRGARAVPDDVVVVSIDSRSSERLGLPNRPRQWPRSVHAELVQELSRQGAAVIAFDVIFEEPRDSALDQQFAMAIEAAGNVLLFEYLRRETVVVDSADGTVLGEVNVEARIPPLPELAEAAFGTAPFPLPKVPAKVSQVWLFKPEMGDFPTLPAVALQAYALPVYDRLLAMLREELPEEARTLPASAAEIRERGSAQLVVRDLYRLFQTYPRLADRLSSRLQGAEADAVGSAMTSALIAMYGGAGQRYLNFYGPPQSVDTVPYHRVLKAADPGIGQPVHLAGKAVFVGFSELRQPEQKDNFYTVFSQRSGLDAAGVEMAATAFANLLEGRFIEPLAGPAGLAVVSGWALVLGVSLRRMSGRATVTVAAALSGLYFATAYASFAGHDLWLPTAVPLLLQAPLALVGALLWNHREVRRERENIREAFGYHLPGEIVDQLAGGMGDIAASERQVYGICLATDAGQYTTLSERMSPTELRDLMNRYYLQVFGPVRRAGGVVSDVVGDAVLALWTARAPDAHLRRQACLSALEIAGTVEEFNERQRYARLPTRIGLHCGDIVLGHVGAIDHYEYRAVGDIVNTASRIEGLNEHLGTRVLASQEVLEGLSGFVTRGLGRFLLKGKTRPVTICELVGLEGPMGKAPPADHARFATGLEAFQAQRWEEAIEAFRACALGNEKDGPARYYLALSERYRRDPPTQWDGVVSIATK